MGELFLKISLSRVVFRENKKFPGCWCFMMNGFHDVSSWLSLWRLLMSVLRGHYEIMIITVIMKEIAPLPFSRSVHVLILFSNLMLLREELGVCLSGRPLAHSV